jgi:ribonuclease BN (tRNA processing enzyme)
MKITCYGPRGSIPSPSRPNFSTVKYGGNTSCYHVEAGPFSFILDLGSGVSWLSDELFKAGKGVNQEHVVLISHWHWDHIQGGPFCGPMYIANNKFHFHGFAPSGREQNESLATAVESVLAEQQQSPHFPVAHGAMPSQKRYVAHQRQFSESFWYFLDEKEQYQFVPSQMLQTQHETLPVDVKNDPRRWVKVTTIPLNHPDGCLGYKVEYMGKVAVYCTDDEPLLFVNAQIKKHAQGADWFLHDAQYTHAQLSGMMQTFGHGTYTHCVNTAKEIGAKIVVLHHHDPKHNDDFLDKMHIEAVDYANASGFVGQVEMAKEGQVWVL